MIMDVQRPMSVALNTFNTALWPHLLTLLREIAGYRRQISYMCLPVCTYMDLQPTNGEVSCMHH